MLLRIAEPGHPMRCGFGKSRDKPLFSRSSIRFSSPLNSSCSFRTRLLSVEVVTRKVKFTASDQCKPDLPAFEQSRHATKAGSQPANGVTESKFGLWLR
jgi:hypothetical protein